MYVHREGDWEVRGMTLMCAFLLLLYLPASTATDPPHDGLGWWLRNAGLLLPGSKAKPPPALAAPAER